MKPKCALFGKVAVSKRLLHANYGLMCTMYMHAERVDRREIEPFERKWRRLAQNDGNSDKRVASGKRNTVFRRKGVWEPLLLAIQETIRRSMGGKLRRS